MTTPRPPTWRLLKVANERALVQCACGTDVICGTARTAPAHCPSCGTRYELHQRIEAERPTGQCLNCRAWLYSNQPNAKYCSEACGNQYRSAQRTRTEAVG